MSFRGGSSWGANSNSFTPRGSGSRGGGYSGYSRQRQPQQTVIVQNSAPRAAAPPRQGARPQGGQQGYQNQRTPQQQEALEQYKEHIKESVKDLFTRTLSLCVLPGNIPMCYASGTCLITDYSPWTDFYRDSCKRYAEKFYRWSHGAAASAAAGSEGAEGESPFTWGLRTVSPKDMHDIDHQNTLVWIWSFIVSNITPYKAARDVFVNGIRAQLRGTPNTQANQNLIARLNDLIRYFTDPEAMRKVPRDPDVLVLIQSVINYIDDVSPGELSQLYESHDARFANLKDLQMAEFLEQAQMRIMERVNFISSEVSDAEDQAQGTGQGS